MPTCKKCGTTWLDVADPTLQSPCPTCEVERLRERNKDLEAIVERLQRELDASRESANASAHVLIEHGVIPGLSLRRVPIGRVKDRWWEREAAEAAKEKPDV